MGVRLAGFYLLRASAVAIARERGRSKGTGSNNAKKWGRAGLDLLGVVYPDLARIGVFSA